MRRLGLIDFATGGVVEISCRPSSAKAARDVPLAVGGSGAWQSGHVGRLVRMWTNAGRGAWTLPPERSRRARLRNARGESISAMPLAPATVQARAANA